MTWEAIDEKYFLVTVCGTIERLDFGFGTAALLHSYMRQINDAPAMSEADHFSASIVVLGYHGPKCRKSLANLMFGSHIIRNQRQI